MFYCYVGSCVACETIRRIFQCNHIRGTSYTCMLIGRGKTGKIPKDGWMVTDILYRYAFPDDHRRPSYSTHLGPTPASGGDDRSSLLSFHDSTYSFIEPTYTNTSKDMDSTTIADHHQPVAKSSFWQAVFNSTNILMGVGILALPLGFKVWCMCVWHRDRWVFICYSCIASRMGHRYIGVYFLFRCDQLHCQDPCQMFGW